MARQDTGPTGGKNRVKAEDAARQLAAAGMFVEGGNGIVYARARQQGIPDRLYTDGDGCVSARALKKIIARHKRQAGLTAGNV